MDILREFLESSTIHGLSYISTSKVTYILFDASIRKDYGNQNLYWYQICYPSKLGPIVFVVYLVRLCVTHYVMLLRMCLGLLTGPLSMVMFMSTSLMFVVHVMCTFWSRHHRPGPSKSSGLLWSSLVSWEQDCWSASHTRSGRSPRWPPRSPPDPSTTWISPSWPSVLRRAPTLPSIMTL